MMDNDLIRVFLPIINAGLVADGYSEVVVKQANQPTLQGVNTKPTIYFFKVWDHRYGFLKRADVWDEDQELMIHTETQKYETKFQLSALVIQKPLTPYSYTAADLVNEAAYILQSDNTRQLLLNAGIGIYRIQDIQNPYFKDDKDLFEASPFLEFTLIHDQIKILTTPVIEEYGVKIKRV